MQTLTVMTYNIKCDWPGNRERTWAERRDAVIGRILASSPDVLAVQEALAHQWRDVADALPGHQAIAVGRDDGAEEGEATALFLDSAALDVRSTDTFWVSPTPRQPGSLWPGAGCPRTVTWIKAHFGGEDILIVNTHLDHVSPEARAEAARMIGGLIAEHALPSIVMGDFNCLRTDEPLTALEAAGLRALPSDGRGTFNDWNPVGPHEEIDFVLTTSHWRGEVEVDRTLVRDEPASDHWPLFGHLHFV